MALEECPEIHTKISVFSSATATFYAPSDESGCHRSPLSLGIRTYSVSTLTQAWGMTGDRVRVMMSRGAGERESWVQDNVGGDRA
jgi:hypothetical protein